jgi:hypothetical protein
MTPLEGAEKGPWRFDPRKDEWELLAGDKGQVPEGRSYHTLVSDGKVCLRPLLSFFLSDPLLQDTLFLHAGCPTSGRLSTLHSYDIPSETWSQLATAPEPGRGGTVLAALPSSADPTAPAQHLIRFGGFAGYELGPENGGGLDVYHIARNEWVTAKPKPDGERQPDKRSVHGLVGIYKPINDGQEIVRALLFSGEKGPAPPELGHAGAGA